MEHFCCDETLALCQFSTLQYDNSRHDLYCFEYEKIGRTYLNDAVAFLASCIYTEYIYRNERRSV